MRINHQVVVFDAADLAAESGFWAGEFNYPTDVALGPEGTLYVADGFNDRIQVFGADGRFLRKWGGPFAMNISGPFNGWFATVTSVIAPLGSWPMVPITSGWPRWPIRTISRPVRW